MLERPLSHYWTFPLIFNLVHCIICGHGWLHNNQCCKTCQNWFCPSWHCLCCIMAFEGAFTTKRQLIHLHCMLCVLWQNLEEDSFDMLYKNDCWTAIPDSIWMTIVPYVKKKKKNVLTSTDNSWFVFLIFERFSIESWFPLFLTHTVYLI